MTDGAGERFALHIEIKQPTDCFNPQSEQAKRYQSRAACWSSLAPPTVPSHTAASTVVVLSDDKRSEFRSDLAAFHTLITFERIAERFPNAIPPLKGNDRAEVPSSPFSLGSRVSHTKFGCGTVSEIEGNKLTIQFDEVGQKLIMDSFVIAA